MNFSPSLGIFCCMRDSEASPHWCCTETNRCFSCLSSYKWRRDDNSEQICPPQVVHSINGASWGRFAAALCVESCQETSFAAPCGPQRERLSKRTHRKQQKTPLPFCFHIFHIHQLLQGNPKAFPVVLGLPRGLWAGAWTTPTGSLQVSSPSLMVLTMVLKCYFNKRWKYGRTQIINVFASLTWRLLPQK